VDRDWVVVSEGSRITGSPGQRRPRVCHVYSYTAETVGQILPDTPHCPGNPLNPPPDDATEAT